MRYRHTQILGLLPFLLSVSAFAADMPVPGIPNYHQVNAHVLRGGQPDSQGWTSLAHLGVKTVIDLRPAGEHSTKAEADAVQAAGMRYVNVPLSGLAAPPEAKIVEVLGLLDADSPVFVHCRRGADRTGTVIACYRIAHDHWENQKALAEARSFGMSWVEFAMQRYVLHFQPARAAGPAPTGSTAPTSTLN